MSLSSSLAAKKLQPTAEWGPVLEVAIGEVFEMMVGAPVSPVTDPDAPVSSELTAMVGLAGKLCGAVTLRCSSHTGLQIATRMMPSEDALRKDPDQVFDAVGEICNMVAGNFKAKITGLADGCMLSVPTVISGGDYRVHSSADSDIVEVQVMFEGSPISVILQVQP